MIWPLSTSAICYSTLYHTHDRILYSPTITLALGMSVDEKLLPQSHLWHFSSYIHLRLWDWGLHWWVCAAPTSSHCSWGISLKYLLYVTLGAPPHHLHSPFRGSPGAPHFILRTGFEVVQTQNSWRLHLIASVCGNYTWQWKKKNIVCHEW